MKKIIFLILLFILLAAMAVAAAEPEETRGTARSCGLATIRVVC